MSELLYNINEELYKKFQPLYTKGARNFDFLGGRRSGKTFFLLQFLLNEVKKGMRVNVATMTAEQGRLGAYQDAKDIINGTPSDVDDFTIGKSPRQIEHINGGCMFFNSYADSETAKGIQCDWLYINEANNFTEQQYIDLSASVRIGTLADRNPNSDCWTERNGFTLIHSTWQDNRKNLTEQQIRWFEGLKERASAPNATSADVAFYRMYYLGEYADIVGAIFTPANIRVEKAPANGMHDLVIFCDPSALRGADYFACVLGAVCDGNIWVLRSLSINEGGYPLVATILQEWCKEYDVRRILIETNGLQGIEFYEFARNSKLPAMPWNSKGNKFERIVANYQTITEQTIFADTDENKEYLKQVYTFDKKCEHDDNIDAVSSLVMNYKWTHKV